MTPRHGVWRCEVITPEKIEMVFFRSGGGQCLTTYDTDAKMIINLADKNFELPTRETNPEAWKILLGHVSARATYDELFDGEGTLTPAQVLEEWICEERDLPTTGKAWEILLEHVKENAMHRDLYLGDLDDDDIIQEIRERRIPYQNIYGEDATVGELFDAFDIIDYIHEAEIPVDAVYDEDDLPAKWTQPIFNRGFLEGQTDTMKLVRELQRERDELAEKC